MPKTAAPRQRGQLPGSSNCPAHNPQPHRPLVGQPISHQLPVVVAYTSCPSSLFSSTCGCAFSSSPSIIDSPTRPVETVIYQRIILLPRDSDSTVRTSSQPPCRGQVCHLRLSASIPHLHGIEAYAFVFFDLQVLRKMSTAQRRR